MSKSYHFSLQLRYMYVTYKARNSFISQIINVDVLGLKRVNEEIFQIAFFENTTFISFLIFLLFNNNCRKKEAAFSLPLHCCCPIFISFLKGLWSKFEFSSPLIFFTSCAIGLLPFLIHGFSLRK